MSQIDTETEVLSEDAADDVHAGADNAKLVPVTESIRYRRRAQSAERKIEQLSEELSRARADAEGLGQQLSQVKAEQKLTRKLASAGALDLETAVLLAKARVKSDSDADLDVVVEQLKKEKQYLFEGGKGAGTVTAPRTASAKDRISGRSAALERAAKQAATTGSRTDLQEYLKLRRNLL